MDTHADLRDRTFLIDRLLVLRLGNENDVTDHMHKQPMEQPDVRAIPARDMATSAAIATGDDLTSATWEDAEWQ